MLVQDLEGKEYKLNLGKYVGKQKENASSLHIKAREILTEEYPFAQILEEVFLPGIKLYADFLLPFHSLMVEVHGQQHEDFNSFHFNNKHSFYRAKRRDSIKKEWCEINNLNLIELYYNESIDEWRKKLQ